MRRSPVQLLSILAAIGAGLAALVYVGSQGKGDGEYRPEKLFANLDLEIIERVEIATSTGNSVLTATDGGWGLESRGGYSVDAHKFRRLILGIASLTPTDRMTDKPEKYGRMGVGSDAPAKGRVKLLDSEGNTLVDLFLGDDRKGKPQGPGGFAPTQGQYVRAEGDEWVYMISGEFRIEESAASWLDSDIIDIADADLTRIAIDHSDSTESLTIARGEGDAFEILTPIPDGYEATTWAISGLARGLDQLTLEDVLPAADATVGELDFAVRFTATGRDGVETTALTAQEGDKHYLKLSATVAESSPSSEVTGAASADDAASNHSATSDSAPTSGDDATEPQIDPAKLATDFNERHAPWVYIISNSKFTGLTKKLSDLIEEKEPEATDPTELDSVPAFDLQTLPQ